MSRKHKNLIPLPEGTSVGDVVRVYLNGWRTGCIKELSGRLVGIQLTGTYLHDGKSHLKWVSIEDIERI